MALFTCQGGVVMAEFAIFAGVVVGIAATIGSAVRLGTRYYIDESSRDRSMVRDRPLVLPPPHGKTVA
jgi:hypothetical protein